jgi:hypothetical protein
MSYNVPIVDFVGPLSNLGANLGNARKQSQIKSALSALGPDASWQEVATALQGIDPQASLSFRKAGMDADALAGYREAQLNQPPQPTEAMRNAEFFGAMDPNDPRVRFAPRGSSRQLARPVINDLVAKGEGAFKTGQLAETFKDDYGGWKAGMVGDAANAIARNTGIGNTGAATWWQDYGRYRNVVRNQLFGSALTGYEGSQWEKADITPGMTPETIRANLKIQQQAADRAARKLARVYVKQGYDQEAIEEALGVSLDDLEPTVGDPVPSATNAGTVPLGERPPIETPALQAEVAKGGFGKQPQTPAPDKIELLKQYANDPEARAAFDEIYGQGAAEFYLTKGR